MIRVLSPIGTVHVPSASEASGLARLSGIRLGFADNSKFNGRLLLETIEARLVEAHGVRRGAWMVKNATGPMDDEAVSLLAKEADAVVAAIGD